MQAPIDKVLLRNLTSEEYKRVQTQIKTQASVTRVEVYVLADDKKIEKKSLVLGLQDGSYAEILRGAEQGDVFVTRVRITAEGE